MSNDDIDKILAEFDLPGEPKDLKRSIRDKYKRRKKRLYSMLEDFLIHAREKLDVSRAGKIHDRVEVEDLIAKAEVLLGSLPKPDEYQIDPSVSIEDILNGGRNIETILYEYEIQKQQNPEEWDEILKLAREKNI